MSAATAAMGRATAATAAARSHTGESVVALRPDRASFPDPAERAPIRGGIVRRDLAITHPFRVLPLSALLLGRRSLSRCLLWTGILCLALFRRRSRLSASEREGLPEKSPRVLSTSFSDTGSSTIRDPSCVTAIRVPGPMPNAARISEGITN